MKYRHFVVIFSLTLLVVIGCVMVLPFAFADVSQIKIFGKYYALFQINDSQFNCNTQEYCQIKGFTYFEDKNHMIKNQNLTSAIRIQDMGVDIPVGSYNETIYHEHVLIDLNQIPKRNDLRTINITSIQMNAFVDYSSKNYTANKTFVTVNYCAKDDFQNLKNKIDNNVDSSQVYEEDWLNHGCQGTLIPIDSVVVDKKDLPKIYSWDLTNAITALENARDKGDPFLSIVITAFALSDNSDNNGIVGFFALNSTQCEGCIGMNSVPSFTIIYTTEPTTYEKTVSFLTDKNTILAITLAIIPFAVTGIGLHQRKRIHKYLKEKIGHQNIN